MREERAAARAVEDDVGVGVVVDDEQVVLARERDDLVVEASLPTDPTGFAGRETIMYLARSATAGSMPATYGRKSCSASSG